jgi:hypothetical protein
MCCRLVSSRAFRRSPICRHCSGVDNIMHIGALCSPHGKKITSTTLQHNRKHNRAPCPTAPSAHASYKGYGFNNAKPPRAPHRNTMMDVVVLGCGPIRMGKGEAAPFIGVHILGEIRPAGGFDILAKSRWADLIGPSIPTRKINHATINHRGPLNGRRIGRGMERRPCLWRRILRGIFDAWGG